jgi:hypothetical protein
MIIAKAIFFILFMFNWMFCGIWLVNKMWE